jgi:hypothetical protein
MAVAVLVEFSNGSNEAYDRVMHRMGLGAGTDAPEGAICHIAGETGEGGFRVVDVWESQEAFERFAQEKIRPITAEEGFSTPDITMWTVYNMLPQREEAMAG